MMEREFRQVLAELELTSNGTVTAWDTSGHGHPASREPRSGDSDPPHLAYRARWDACRTLAARMVVLEEARRELDQIRRRPTGTIVREETRQQRDARIVRDGAGWPLADVARHFRCGERDVIRARINAGRHVHDGSPRPDLTDRERRLLELHGEGLTQQQIATRLTMSQGHVSKQLARLLR